VKAVMLPMYKVPNRHCWLCEKIIPINCVSYHVFDFNVKAVKLNLYHICKQCAKREGLIPEDKIKQVNGRSVYKKDFIDTHTLMKFWSRRCELAEAKGDYNFATDWCDVNFLNWPSIDERRRMLGLN